MKVREFQDKPICGKCGGDYHTLTYLPEEVVADDRRSSRQEMLACHCQRCNYIWFMNCMVQAVTQ